MILFAQANSTLFLVRLSQQPLPQSMDTKWIGVPEDHMGMARYATRFKIGYKRICSVLGELVENEARSLNSAKAAWITGDNTSVLSVKAVLTISRCP
jgi:hypothetical protein